MVKKSKYEISIEDAVEPENRRMSRRPIYLGEDVRCELDCGNQILKCLVVDLSTSGLAAVLDQKYPVHLKLGSQVKVSLKRVNEIGVVEGTITNLSQMIIRNQPQTRIGLKFHLCDHPRMDEFTKSISEALVFCKTYIRPQVSYMDPFFFNERIMFQVNGFTSNGIDLVSSSRWKSILPGQMLNLEVYIPGKKIFNIRCRNSHHYYHSHWKGRFRIYVQYEDCEPEYHDAVIDYLLTINDDISPKIIRDYGFKLGLLDQCCHISRAKYNLNRFPKDIFLPTLLAAPKDPGYVFILQNSREMCLHIGSNPVAYFNLAFFDGEINKIRGEGLQTGFPEILLSSSHIVLDNLLVNDRASITDILVPLLQHAVRIGAQSKSKYLVVIAKSSLVKVLSHIGFCIMKPTNKSAMEPSLDTLMVLELHTILSNRRDDVESKVWVSLYQKVSHFLKA